MKALIEFEQQLQRASDIPALSQALVKVLQDLSIKTYSYTYYVFHPKSVNKLRYDECSSDFKIWHDHYLEEHYNEIDTTLDKSYYTTLPTYWDIEQQIKDARTQREKKMREDAKKFGAMKGVSFPIHGPNEEFALFLVVQMAGETCLEDWQEKQYLLHPVGHYYYHYLQKHLLKQEPDSDKNKYQLNQRELQCLSLTEKRYAVSDIAETLSITVRTVNFHIQNANKKLGVKNKYLAVAKALQKGLIEV